MKSIHIPAVSQVSSPSGRPARPSRTTYFHVLTARSVRSGGKSDVDKGGVIIAHILGVREASASDHWRMDSIQKSSEEGVVGKSTPRSRQPRILSEAKGARLVYATAHFT